VEKAAAGVWSTPEATPLEVDLRGMEASDAVMELDQGIDRAVLAGLTELRVIHGVGRGILRAAVEKHLHGHPQVASQRPGEVGEGGRGVTVAKLR
jgi:DNA mismatch repair protein MutS2